MAFVLSKCLWALVSPGSLLSFLLLAGVWLGRSPRPCRARLGRGFGLFVCAAMLAITALPVGEWVLTPLESRFSFDPPEQVDGIIVLGGDEQTWISQQRGMPVAMDSMRRYERVAELARRYPDAQLIFSGGSGLMHKAAHLHDYEVARDLMAGMGIPVERMIFEKESRNSWENATLTADIVRPKPGQNWLLVTSAWHMARAMGCFRRAGWHVYAAPTGYFTPGGFHLRWLFSFDAQMHMLTLATHEYIGLASYWLMGRTDSLWPG